MTTLAMNPWKIIGWALILVAAAVFLQAPLSGMWTAAARWCWALSLRKKQSGWEPRVGDEVLVSGVIKSVSRVHGKRLWVQTLGTALIWETEVPRQSVLFTGRRDAYVWRPS